MIDVGADLQRAYDDGYAHGIADAMRWIPCNERLPESYNNYLITTGEGDTDIGTFSPEFKRWYICDADGFKRIDDVIAWMPLPEPYKEEP